MATDKNIKKHTATDIEKYHKGMLSNKEMHDLEKAALDDPFLAEAIEGYENNPVNIEADLNELRLRLLEKNTSAKIIPIGNNKSKRNFYWLRVAALIFFMLSAGLLVYQFSSTKDDEGKSIAKVEPEMQQKEISQTDSNTVITKPDADLTTNEKPSPAIATKPNEPLKKDPSANINLPIIKKLTQRQANDFVQEKREESFNYEVKPNSIKINGDSLAIASNKSTADDKKVGALLMPSTNESQYKIKDNTFLPNHVLLEQNNVFQGRVTDATNTGVPFANISNTEDNVGTYSDANGYFKLISPDSSLNVLVKSVGFNNSNIELKSNLTNNQVVLKEDANVPTQTVSTKKSNAVKRKQGNNMELTEPEPEDGWDRYDNYLTNNLKVPDDIKRKQTTNKVVEVSFEVNQYGEPVNFKIKKSLCGHCDEEAIRLIKNGPKWKYKTKNKRTSVTVPF